MEALIITGYSTNSQGVILETNIPGTLKSGNVSGIKKFVSWDKIGSLLFDDYATPEESEKLRSKGTVGEATESKSTVQYFTCSIDEPERINVGLEKRNLSPDSIVAIVHEESFIRVYYKTLAE